jgi:hypothetical protein
MKQKDEFHTANLQLAVYPAARKIPLIGIERTERFSLFFFPKKEADSGAKRFISGQALIEPLAIVAAIRELRARVDSLGGDQK